MIDSVSTNGISTMLDQDLSTDIRLSTGGWSLTVNPYTTSDYTTYHTFNYSGEQSNFGLSDVKIVYRDKNSSEPIGIVCTFMDGSQTKAFIQEDDKFDLDVGLTVCIAKRLSYLAVGGKNNGNNALNHFKKLLLNEIRKREDIKKQKKEAEARIRRKRFANARRKERRRIKRKQEQIDIQTQAILNANKIQKTRDLGIQG